MTLTEKEYKKRIIDNTIADNLKLFGAISIEGPKWSGKTWTGLNHANSVFYVADPDGNYANRALAELSPTSALEGKAPHLIDEWQTVPSIWDAVRYSVDRSTSNGQYLLTDSSVIDFTKVVHSGVGRIASIRMRTMSLYESGDSCGKISLKKLFEGHKYKPVKSDMTFDSIIEISLRGGFPGSIDMNWKQGVNVATRYIDRTVQSDISMVAEEKIDPGKIMATIKSLARNNSTLVSSTTIAKDIVENDESVNKDSILKYIKLLKKIYFLEEIPGWATGMRSRQRLLKSPKRFLADPSLTCAALNATPEKLKRDLNTYGFIFESMCLRDLLIYAEANDGKVFHYRDKSELEADAIIEMNDGKWGAFEIKLGMNQVDSASASLIELKDKMIADDLPPPAILAVIVGVSGFFHQRDDGVYVIPIDCLAP